MLSSILTLIPGADTASAGVSRLRPSYQPTSCSFGYYSDHSAAQYLNLSAADTATCPTRAMFVNARGYFPSWAFETNVFNEHGLVMVYPGGGCSDAPDTGPNFDFQLPCKAHDYCYDLRRAGFSGTVTDNDCDYTFFQLMSAHCNDRFLPDLCQEIAVGYFGAVIYPDVAVDPAPVRLVATHSSKCANVANASSLEGEWIVQYWCVGYDNERFRMFPAPGFPGWFQVRALHSGKCVDVGADSKLRQYTCSSSAARRFRIQGSYLQDTYTLRSASHGGSWCWDVPGSSIGTVQLIEYFCNETNNQRWVML